MTTLNFIKKLNTTPQVKTQIFRLKSPAVTERSVKALAMQFKLKGVSREITKDENSITYVEGIHRLTVNKLSGAVRYIDSTKWQMDNGVSDVKLKDAEAIKIAEEYITVTKLVPLKEIKPLKVTKLKVGSLQKGSNEVKERIIDLAVVFHRVINEVPVEGPGGKVVVYINADKAITGCDKIWRDISEEYQKLTPDKLQAPKFAEQSLEKYANKLRLDKVEVDDVKFGYFEFGPNEKQAYLQPAYIMPYKIKSIDDKVLMKSAYVIYAATKPVGRISYPIKLGYKEPVRK